MAGYKMPVLMPFAFPHLTKDCKEVARRELFEDETKQKDILQQFRKILKDDSNYVGPTDEGYLIQFLRVRKYNLKNAYQSLQKHFQLRYKHPDIYNSFHYESVIKNVTTSGVMGVQPFRDVDGCVVYVFQLGDWNPDTFPMPQFVKALYVGLTQALSYPATQVHGFKFVCDFKGFGLKQLAAYTPSYIRLMVSTIQGGVPMRIKEIHIVNASYAYKVIYTIAKPFLRRKMRERIFVHGDDFSILHQHVSPATLPAEYGGFLGHFNNTAWIELLRSSEKDILANLSLTNSRR